MAHSIKARVLLASVVIASLLAQGCSTCFGTKFGWYPSMVNVDPNQSGAEQYAVVREFAYEVADGYDTRRTTNRYAVYGGALLAGAAAGAMAGLAAFDSGNSAIIGIPIGTTFAGGAFAIFQSEPKAVIYGLGASRVDRLIQQSGERIVRFEAIRGNGPAEQGRLQEQLAAAQAALATAQSQLRAVQTAAVAAKKEAAKAAPSDNPTVADALMGLANKGADTLVADAKAVVAEAQAQVNSLLRKSANVAVIISGPPKSADPSVGDPAKAPWLGGEAVCLNRDVRTTMDRVDRALRLLDPANVGERLTKVKDEAATYPQPAPAASATPAGTPPVGGAAAPTPVAQPTPTPAVPDTDPLADLKAPPASSCLEHDL